MIIYSSKYYFFFFFGNNAFIEDEIWQYKHKKTKNGKKWKHNQYCHKSWIITERDTWHQSFVSKISLMICLWGWRCFSDVVLDVVENISNLGVRCVRFHMTVYEKRKKYMNSKNELAIRLAYNFIYNMKFNERKEK